MRVGFGETWSQRGRSAAWGSSTIALVVTSALFAAAFAAMSRFDAPTINFDRAPVERTTLVYAPPPKPAERVEPRTRAVPRPAAEVQSNASSPTLVAPSTVPSSLAPPAPVDVPRDSASAPAKVNRALFLPPSPTSKLYESPKFELPAATPAGRGAPRATAGVTAPRTPGADTPHTVNIYERELAEIRAEMARQNSPHAIGAPAGKVGAGMSIPVPLLSSGPSRAERRKNEAIDADNQERLGRLQQLIVARRDSARADSLRRDSLARRVRP